VDFSRSAPCFSQAQQSPASASFVPTTSTVTKAYAGCPRVPAHTRC
jgi:hypothetical protein